MEYKVLNKKTNYFKKTSLIISLVVLFIILNIISVNIATDKLMTNFTFYRMFITDYVSSTSMIFII